MKEGLERAVIYNLSNGYGLGRRIAHRLGKEPSPFRGLVFDKGKRLFYPLERVEGKSLYIIQDLWGNKGERIVNLLLFIDECQKERPKEINIIIPYIPFKSYKVADRENLIVFLESLQKAGVNSLFTLDNDDPVLIKNRIIKVKTITFSQVFLPNIEYFAYKCSFLNGEITLITPNRHYINRLKDFAFNLPGSQMVDISILDESLHDKAFGAQGKIKNQHILIIDESFANENRLLSISKCCMDLGAKDVRIICTHATDIHALMKPTRKHGIVSVMVSDSVPHPSLLCDEVSASEAFALAILEHEKEIQTHFFDANEERKSYHHPVP